jgi:rsbT co-antagonist protein RsbR
MKQEGKNVQSNKDDDQAERLLIQYGITDEDKARIRAYGKSIVPKLDELVRLFYDWLETQPEFDEFFPDQETLARAKNGQLGYWRAFFTDDINESYLATRAHVGETHARIGLPLPIYFAGMNIFHRVVIEDLYDGRLSKEER